MFSKKLKSKKLYDEFISSKIDKRKEEILNQFIKKDSEDEIIKIVKSGKFNKENKYYILIYLIENNFNYEKLKPLLDLFAFRNDGIEEYFQNIVIRRLIDSKEKNKEDELIHILNNYEYFTIVNKNEVYNFLTVENIKKNKLKEIFNKFTDNYKEKIVTELIEKGELEQLESSYLNTGFNEIILNSFISSKDENIIKLKSLYNIFIESKHKKDKNAIPVLINTMIDVTINPKNKKKIKSYKRDEIKFLFSQCTDISLRDKIVAKMLKNDEQDILLDILIHKNCSKEYKAILVTYLIDKSNDYNILKILFQKSPKIFKDKIIHKLLSMNAFKELEKNYLGSGYDEKIFEVLISNSQDDKNGLLDLYYSNISLDAKANIINILLDLNAINELSKILFDNKCSEQTEIIIMSHIVEESSNTQLLKNIFERGNDSFKIRVIDRLIAIDAVKELEENYFDLGYDERIIHLLLNAGKFNNQSLLFFYKKSNDLQSKNIIISNLFKLGASKELFQILNDNECTEDIKNKIIIFFIDESLDIEILRKVFEICNKAYQEMIVEKLLNENNTNELIAYYLNIGYNFEIIKLYLKLDIDITVNNLLELYKTVEGNISKNEIVDKLIEFKAVYELKEIYKTSDQKNSLFPKLLDLSIFSEKNIVTYIEYNIEKSLPKDIMKNDLSVDTNFFIKIIFKYLELIGCSSNPVKIQKTMNKSFLYFFNKGLADGKEYYLALCSFINIKKFKKEVISIKEKFVIADDIDSHQRKIKDKYSKLMGSAKYKSEIDKILKERDVEIAKLFTKEKFDIFYKISEMYISNTKIKNSKKEPEDNIDSEKKPYTGKVVSLEKMLNELKIVNDYQSEEDKITNFLLQKLNRLTDSDEIMAVKTRVEKMKSLLVSKNDFCYTVQNFTNKDLENHELIHSLGGTLVRSKDIDVKKVILELSSKSDKKIWLIYIHNISNDEGLIDSIYNSMKNKFILGNVTFILDRENLWQEIRFKMLIFENFFNFIFNLSKNDIPDLLAFTRTEIKKFPEDMQNSINKILANIIKRNS